MRLVPDPNPACVACGLPLAPAGMTPPPGYRRHPGCDPAGVELYCTGCQQGPAGCGCPVTAPVASLAGCGGRHRREARGDTRR